MIEITAVVNLKPLKDFIKHFDEEVVQAAVDESAKAVAEGAKRNASQYRDTGSEMEGYYVVTPLTDNYADAVGRATGLNPVVQIVPKQVHHDKKVGAVVGNVSAHNKVNEVGSAALNRPARAMLRRAVEAERSEFPGRLTNRLRRHARRHGLDFG